MSYVTVRYRREPPSEHELLLFLSIKKWENLFFRIFGKSLKFFEMGFLKMYTL